MQGHVSRAAMCPCKAMCPGLHVSRAACFLNMPMMYVQRSTVEKKLRAAGIDHVFLGDTALWETMVGRDVLDYFSWANNIHDDTVADEVVETPTRGIGQSMSLFAGYSCCADCNAWCTPAANQDGLSNPCMSRQKVRWSSFCNTLGQSVPMPGCATSWRAH